MKKTYMTPSTSVVNILQSEHILAGSVTGNGRNVGQRTVSGGSQLSRQHSDWDEED